MKRRKDYPSKWVKDPRYFICFRGEFFIFLFVFFDLGDQYNESTKESP